MPPATWSPDDAAWFASNPHGLPPEPVPYVHSHQRTPRHPGKDAGRARVDPWLERSFRERHPGLGRGALALTWLRETFAGHP